MQRKHCGELLRGCWAIGHSQSQGSQLTAAFIIESDRPMVCHPDGVASGVKELLRNHAAFAERKRVSERAWSEAYAPLLQSSNDRLLDKIVHSVICHLSLSNIGCRQGA
jgi:hypothetical protein